FSENAGGSQVLGTVAAKLSSYLLDSNVQMGNYPLAHAAKARVDAGYAASALLLGTDVDPDEVLFGASATQLVENLSRMIEQSIIDRHVWSKGDEIIISQADHETNRGAWKRLAERQGLVIKQWNVSPLPASASGHKEGSPYATHLDTAELAKLITDRTRLVCFTACSNLLGRFVDLPAAVSVVKERSGGKAWTCVDAVAYAPHRRVCPTALGVDFMFWSWYKVYGPHIGTMYLSRRAQTELLTRLNHHFLHTHAGTYPFQPSSPCYESIYALTAVVEYLVRLGQRSLGSEAAAAAEIDWVGALANKARAAALSKDIDAAYAWISTHESELLAKLMPALRALEAQDLISIVGDAQNSSESRAPTVAFVGVGQNAGKSEAIHARLTKSNKFGAQQGHMYAYDLVQALNLPIDDGVVRISLVHYNTIAEAEAVAKAIEEAVRVP
ncbi:hypothetical protein OC834_006189, partial [Tilletia horrida]